MTDYHQGLPQRPCLDFTVLEAVRRVHWPVTIAELEYAVGWESGALSRSEPFPPQRPGLGSARGVVSGRRGG